MSFWKVPKKLSEETLTPELFGCLRTRTERMGRGSHFRIVGKAVYEKYLRGEITEEELLARAVYF